MYDVFYLQKLAYLRYFNLMLNAQLIKESFDDFLSLFFPPVCLGCGNLSSFLLCKHCQRQVIPKVMTEPFEGPLDEITAFFPYELHIKTMLMALKFEGVKEAGRLLHRFCGNLVQFEADAIVFVPLSRQRLKSRGFNQVELIFESVSQFPKIHVIRQLNTVNLYELSYEKRKKVLDSAFVLENGEVEGKNIVIFDDIYTTGSTMNEIAKCLKKAGAKKVSGMALAYA